MQDFEDPRQRCQEDRRDFDSAQIPRSEDEHSGFAGSQSRDLQRTVSQPLILGEHNPAALADRLKPDAVFLITRKMVVVDLDYETGLDELRSDGSMPSDLSMKNTVSSGGFAADGFFDLTGVQAEVVREVRHRIAGPIAFVDGGNRYARTGDHGSAKRN